MLGILPGFGQQWGKEEKQRTLCDNYKYFLLIIISQSVQVLLLDLDESPMSSL